MQNSDKIIIDTYAWIEYFKGSEEGVKAKKFIEGDVILFTPAIVIVELSDKYRRDQITEWETRRHFISLKSAILPLDEHTADIAGVMKQELKKQYKDAGLADAIVSAHASVLNGDILTGDKHLKNLENSIDITK
ncbi:MAG: PIN domain-containing protein [Candidatus Aenigmarchaeota archaeon]|nr:PIN domain-containing protein [Candidatus Aenigmarchaeota archaeon]